jgi:translation machinery-associated protein 16
LIEEVFITRNDPRIAELAAERRAGRPKLTEHIELEELKRRELAEYESGFGASFFTFFNQSMEANKIEVPDLTDDKTTTFMWNWLEKDVSIDRSHVDMLRQVRITKDSDELIVSRAGRLKGVLAETMEGDADDWTNVGGEEVVEKEMVIFKSSDICCFCMYAYT